MCSIGVILPICMALAISISSVCYVVGVIGSVAKLNVIKFIFTVELIFANSCGGNTVIFIIIEINRISRIVYIAELNLTNIRVDFQCRIIDVKPRARSNILRV